MTKGITEINEENIEDGNKRALEVGAMLLRGAEIKTLRLAGSNITNEAVQKILNAGSQLESLDLSENSISGHMLHFFSLYKNRFELRSLNLSGNPLGENYCNSVEGVKKLLDACPKLTHLYLKNTFFKTKDVIEILKLLKNNTTIEVLDLSGYDEELINAQKLEIKKILESVMKQLSDVMEGEFVRDTIELLSKKSTEISSEIIDPKEILEYLESNTSIIDLPGIDFCNDILKRNRAFRGRPGSSVCGITEVGNNVDFLESINL